MVLPESGGGCRSGGCSSPSPWFVRLCSSATKKHVILWTKATAQ